MLQATQLFSINLTSVSLRVHLARMSKLGFLQKSPYYVNMLTFNWIRL